MQRYGVVLQELRVEVRRNNSYLASVSTPRPAGQPAEEAEHPRSYQGNQIFIAQQSDGANLGTTDSGSGVRDNRDFNCPGGGHRPCRDVPLNPTTSMEVLDSDLNHMSSWGEFDSLVS